MSPIAQIDELLKVQEFCDYLIRRNAEMQEQIKLLTEQITERNVADLQKYNEDKRK
jgi:hypothetical protein